MDEPVSPDGKQRNSLESPTKIVYRAISRSSKPPSLKLLASNGSTAVVTPTPAPPVPAKETSPTRRPALQSSDERPLPPPPPEKSERRKSLPRSKVSMGNKESKPERRDSKEPQESAKATRTESSTERSQSSQATKRKPLPPPANAKKFPSLLDMKNTPRGRSIAPKATTATVENAVRTTRADSQESSRRPSIASIQEKFRKTSIPRNEDQPRKTSIPRSSVEEATSRNALSGQRPTFSKTSLPSLPPQPSSRAEEQPSEAQRPPPPPPRKAFIGLPSNPRSKSTDARSPKHMRGKSSTGFDIMKVYIPFPQPAYIRHSRQREWRLYDRIRKITTDMVLIDF